CGAQMPGSGEGQPDRPEVRAAYGESKAEGGEARAAARSTLPHDWRRRTVRIVLLGAAGFAVLALAFIAILTLTRTTPVSYVGALRGDSVPGVDDPLFARTMELYTSTPMRVGNRVELLLDGDGTYPPLWADLRSAESTITVQLYYSQPGVVADSMQSILMERARAGVRVLVLLDAFGSRPLGAGWGRRLEEAGARVVWLRPLKWYTLHKATNRSH